VYAIIETGGKQYRVEPGERLYIERLPEHEPGEVVEFDRVLLVSDGERREIGRPYVPGAKVIARLEAEEKGEKIIVFKYRAKKRYRRKRGHRQRYFRAVIEEIRV